MVMILLSFYKYYQNSWYSPISSNSPVNCEMIVTKLWFVAWFLDFYDKNAILLKEAGSTRFQNLQERFGNILRIAPLLNIAKSPIANIKSKIIMLQYFAISIYLDITYKCTPVYKKSLTICIFLNWHFVLLLIEKKQLSGWVNRDLLS